MKRANAKRGKTPDKSTQRSKRSDNPHTRLTRDIVEHAQAPATGSVTLWDSEDTGFGIRIFAATARHPQGFRSFFANYRMIGRERRIKIGSYPDWTVSAARDAAKALRKRIDAGEDPAAEKTERRASTATSGKCSR